MDHQKALVTQNWSHRVMKSSNSEGKYPVVPPTLDNVNNELSIEQNSTIPSTHCIWTQLSQTKRVVMCFLPVLHN